MKLSNIPIGAGNNVEGQIFYAPQDVSVMKETVVLWNNNDEVAHTVTSSLDFGDTFDSGLIDAGSTFQIDTTGLETDTYGVLLHSSSMDDRFYNCRIMLQKKNNNI